jgi:hypothetical protein
MKDYCLMASHDTERSYPMRHELMKQLAEQPLCNWALDATSRSKDQLSTATWQITKSLQSIT